MSHPSLKVPVTGHLLPVVEVKVAFPQVGYEFILVKLVPLECASPPHRVPVSGDGNLAY